MVFVSVFPHHMMQPVTSNKNRHKKIPFLIFEQMQSKLYLHISHLIDKFQQFFWRNRFVADKSRDIKHIVLAKYFFNFLLEFCRISAVRLKIRSKKVSDHNSINLFSRISQRNIKNYA